MGLDRCLLALTGIFRGWPLDAHAVSGPARPMVLEPRGIEHDVAGALSQRQRPRRDDAC